MKVSNLQTALEDLTTAHKFYDEQEEGVGAWSISALMRTVAEGGVFCFAAAAGPDRTVFFYRDYFGRLARTLVGAVAVGRVLGLATATEGQGLASDRIDFVGRGLPRHVLRHRRKNFFPKNNHPR